MGCGFAKCFLVVFNIIFLLSGSGILSAGIWLKDDPDSVKIQKLMSVDSVDEAISSTAYVLVGFGGLAFLGGLLGCIGVIKHWKWALRMNFIILVVIFLGEISGGIMAVVSKSKLHCCGVTSYMDYSKYADFNNIQPVPSSCCAGDFTTCTIEANQPWFPGSKTNYLYNEGCLSSLQNQLTSNLSIIKGMGFGIAMIQLIGIFLTYKVCRSVDF